MVLPIWKAFLVATHVVKIRRALTVGMRNVVGEGVVSERNVCLYKHS